MNNQSANQIKTTLDTTTECLSSLNNLKICTDSWDPIIIFLVSQKLDAESLKDWEEQAYRNSSEDMPTWDDMKRFLEFRFRTLELATPTVISREKQSVHKSFHVTIGEGKGDRLRPAHVTARTPQCDYCKASGHHIKNCKDFIEKPVEERHSFVKKKNRCFNCLSPYHRVYEFLCKKTCGICHRRHHFLLHRSNQEEKKKKVEDNSPEYNITTAHFSREQPGPYVLLATAQVKIKTSSGVTCKLRALIDQGSEASFISAGAVELLGLPKSNTNVVVTGVREEEKIVSNNSVDLSVTSRFKDGKEIPVKAFVLKTISTILPSKHIKMNWPELQTSQLADPTCFTPGGVEILLGADVFSRIIEDGLMKMSGGAVAQKTCLGWIISGQTRVQSKINY